MFHKNIRTIKNW